MNIILATLLQLGFCSEEPKLSYYDIQCVNRCVNHGGDYSSCVRACGG